MPCCTVWKNCAGNIVADQQLESNGTDQPDLFTNGPKRQSSAYLLPKEYLLLNNIFKRNSAVQKFESGAIEDSPKAWKNIGNILDITRRWDMNETTKESSKDCQRPLTRATNRSNEIMKNLTLLLNLLHSPSCQSLTMNVELPFGRNTASSGAS
jgi:hypothetical protein